MTAEITAGIAAGIPAGIPGGARRVRFAAGAAAALLLCVCRLASAQDLPWKPPEAAVGAGRTPQAGTTLFYFFSPDWRPPDLGKLTVAVEEALASGGVRVSFQAFTRYEDFERQVADAPPQFLLAPAWLASPPPSARSLPLTVIAHPLHRGKSTYRKALMTRPGTDSIDDLAHGSIAATVHAMGSGSPEVVLDAFHLAPGSAKVVPVPKDVDALLALSFGQVDAALVTSLQYEQLSRTNPGEAERLRVLAFSPEVRLPPVFALASAEPALREQFRDALVRLGEQPQGASVLAMLGFDAFVAEPGTAAGTNPTSRPGGGEETTEALEPTQARTAAPVEASRSPAAPVQAGGPKPPAAGAKRPRTGRSHRR